MRQLWFRPMHLRTNLKKIQTTEHYTQIKSLYIYRKSPHTLTRFRGGGRVRSSHVLKKSKLIVNFEFKFLNPFTPMRSSVTLKYLKFWFLFELLSFWYVKFRKLNIILNQKSSNLKSHTVFKVSPFMLFDSHILVIPSDFRMKIIRDLEVLHTGSV